MLHDIPDAVLGRMKKLERLDRKHRKAGLEQELRLRQVPPGTGRLLALLAVGSPPGNWLELGTSGGYSALWLSLACREAGATLTTVELRAAKVDIARETFAEAGVEDVVELVHADALEYLRTAGNISFCFLDTAKEIYRECYDLIVPRLVHGGLLVVDNVVSHANALRPMLDFVASDPRVDSVLVPVGRGELVCRKSA